MKNFRFILLLCAVLCFAGTSFSLSAGAENTDLPEEEENESTTLVCPHENLISEITLAPACTEIGERTLTCTLCGFTFSEEIPLLGHDFGEWTETKKATYREEGRKERFCLRCETNETRSLPRLTHLAAKDCPAGDADMDGKVTAADARLILRLAVGLDDGLDAPQIKKADFDGKDGVTAADARYTLRVTVGMDPYLPTLKTGYKFKGHTSKNYVLAEKDGITYVVSPYGYTLIANKTYGLPASYAPGDLTGECRTAFNELVRGAAGDGIHIFLVSGYRSYAKQDSLYRRYSVSDGKALADTYSARPGHSEHQTGLAIDVNSLSPSFANTKEGRWLAANAHKYGFIIRYLKGKENKTGYSYEPWHIRYVGKSLAEALYNSGESMEEFFGITSVYQ